MTVFIHAIQISVHYKLHVFMHVIQGCSQDFRKEGAIIIKVIARKAREIFEPETTPTN